MTGFLYAIGDGTGRVKLGWSNDPVKRLVNLQTACPSRLQLLGLVEATKEQERELHLLFRGWRLSGEWFALVGPVVELVAMLPRPKPKLKPINIPADAHPLERYRRGQRLTLEALAQRLGVTRTALCRIENGGRRLSPKLVDRFSKITGIDPRELRPDMWKLFSGETSA